MLREVFLRVLRFSPLLKNQGFTNSNSTRNQVDEEPLFGCATSKSLFIYLCFARVSFVHFQIISEILPLSYFNSLSGVTLSDILYLKYPRDKETTLSIILHFSTARICYQNPNNDSSVPIKLNCSFPENLCFKFDNKTEDNEQVTIQGCISAEQCRHFDDEHLQCCEGDLCNNSKCHGYTNAKIY